jgi:hypothetical protein
MRVLVRLGMRVGVGGRPTLLVADTPALAIGVGVDASGGLAIRAVLDVAADGNDEALRNRRDLRDRCLERLRVALRRLLESRDLAHELARRGLDLAGGCWIVLVT